MEKYLHKCLDSLIIDEEGMKQLEVLVINDGSKDSSSEIAHEYQDKYPDTFRVIDKENGNYGSCINRGLKEATGKYVKVLDADDSFDTIGFKLYIDLLCEIDVDLVVTNYNIVNEAGEVLNFVKRGILERTILPISEVIDEFLNPQIQMHAVTYKTQNLRDIDYYQSEGISYTDQEWMFMPMTTVKTLYYLPVVVYKYLVGRAGQTVEMEAHIRNISHHVKKNFDMLNAFQNNIVEEVYTRYLLTRLSNSFSFVYYVYMIINGNAESMSVLREIDNKLKSCPRIYNILDNKYINPHIKIKYIKRWREKGFPIRKSIFEWLVSYFVKVRLK